MDTKKAGKSANEIPDDFLDLVAGGKYVLKRISKEDASIILKAQEQTGDKSLQVVVSETGLFYSVKQV